MTLEVELDRPGRHQGALLVPWSRDESAYGQLVVPVTVLNGGPGPTLLLTGGVHGDEYEGQIVLAELARTLDAADLRGRVILVPRANPPACRAGRRTSPVDGGNLARLFPGQESGGLTSSLAAAIARELLPLADAVVDLHAGGASLEYAPCAWGRLPARADLAARVLDMMQAFGTSYAAVTLQPGASGTLVADALASGRPAFAAELGGGGGVTTASLSAAREGCRNALAHMGMLEAARAPLAALMAVEPAHFLRSPAAGLFEPYFHLGQAVEAGEAAGVLHDPERAQAEPVPLAFRTSGIVICRRVPARCEAGDVLAHLARPAQRAELLRL